MFGDDPDSSVTTTRFGFGVVFGRAQDGVGGCAEGLGGLTRGSQNPVGLRAVNKGKGGTQQLRTDASFLRTCRCNAHDAMR